MKTKKFKIIINWLAAFFIALYSVAPGFGNWVDTVKAFELNAEGGSDGSINNLQAPNDGSNYMTISRFNAAFSFSGLDLLKANKEENFSLKVYHVTDPKITGINPLLPVRYKMVVTRNGSVLANQTIYYSDKEDSSRDNWHNFTTNGNGIGYFGPQSGFPLMSVPEALTSVGVETFFAANFGPGDYTLQIFIVDASNNEEYKSSQVTQFTIAAPQHEQGLEISFTQNDLSKSITANPVVNPVQLSFEASDRVDDWVSIEIKNGDNVKRFYPNSCDGNYTCEVTWDGDVSHGDLVDGDYRVIVRVEENTDNHGHHGDDGNIQEFISPYLITVRTSAPTLSNLSVLTADIVSALALHDGATEGTSTGQYAVGSKAALFAAIGSARAVTSTDPQSAVDAALAALNSAVITFSTGKVIPPVDIIPPVITILGDNPFNIFLGNSFSDPGATSTDNVDGDLTSKIAVTNTVDTTAVGSYSIGYSVTDSAGNSTTASRVVNVSIAPILPALTQSSGGGGGGGGGAMLLSPFQSPDGGVKISVVSVVGNNVLLALDGGNSAVAMALSESESFENIPQEKYQLSRTWTLSNVSGTPKIYAKFYNVNGMSSEVVSVTVSAVPPVVIGAGHVLGVKITRIDSLLKLVKLGQWHNNVKLLQTELRKAGHFPAKIASTGFYGPITKAAVAKYIAGKK